jgi:Terminase large subunit, T4likevirus-type, N-terminal
MSMRDLAYQIDPALWVREVLGIEPAAWQEEFLRVPRGATIVALTARQVGKTTTAAWAIAHHMMFTPNGLNVIACPAQRQSKEAVRRVREILIRAGAELKSDNIYELELKNGARALALPSTDDSIRGVTVDGWIVADEAARLSDDLISALRPMRARRPEARFAMLSTAWSRTDPFWTAWESDDASVIRLRATAEVPGLFAEDFLESERHALGQHTFSREYLGIPLGAEASLFSWDLYERTTAIHVPLASSGRAFGPPLHEIDDWPGFRELIIAHDVGRSRDRSTAVVGGNSPFGQRLLGIAAAEELPLNLVGAARASALATVDRRHYGNALIVADLSNDPSYADALLEAFGPRVIGLHIGRYGTGMEFERRPVRHSSMLVYNIGRSYLLELLRNEMQSGQVRLANSATLRRAYEQLADLETEHRDTGTVYTCPQGRHDDLGISLAMLCWAAQHPHLKSWLRPIELARRPRRRREAPSPAGWT